MDLNLEVVLWIFDVSLFVEHDIFLKDDFVWWYCFLDSWAVYSVSLLMFVTSLLFFDYRIAFASWARISFVSGARIAFASGARIFDQVP